MTPSPKFDSLKEVYWFRRKISPEIAYAFEDNAWWDKKLLSLEDYYANEKNEKGLEKNSFRVYNHLKNFLLKNQLNKKWNIEIITKRVLCMIN
ncbi:MAG: hypothetical protein AABX88_00185 [Nanoarchaeota archaeon]